MTDSDDRIKKAAEDVLNAVEGETGTLDERGAVRVIIAVVLSKYFADRESRIKLLSDGLTEVGQVAEDMEWLRYEGIYQQTYDIDSGQDAISRLKELATLPENEV